MECYNLSSVNIPYGVVSIGGYAFHNCALKSINIPNSVVEIGGNAFSETQLEQVIFGSGIKTIEEDAFDVDTLNGCTYTGSEEEWKNVNVEKKYLYSGNKCLTPVKYLNLSNDFQVVSVTLNNNLLNFEFPAVMVKGRTLVPLRTIFEAIGASVAWNSNTQTAESSLGSTTVSLTIGSNILYKNGSAVNLDVAPQLINGYTMVPIRAIAEAFGANVGWNDTTKTVVITN